MSDYSGYLSAMVPPRKDKKKDDITTIIKGGKMIKKQHSFSMKYKINIIHSVKGDQTMASVAWLYTAIYSNLT